MWSDNTQFKYWNLEKQLPGYYLIQGSSGASPERDNYLQLAIPLNRIRYSGSTLFPLLKAEA